MSSTSTTLDPGFATQDTAWVSLTVITIVLSLATIAVGLRFYTRIFLIKQLGWDDYCVIITLFVAIADGGAVLSNIPFGLGKHTATLDPSVIPLYLRNFWLSIVLYNLTLILIKLTFILQYYRVLAVHKMKRVIWIVGIIIMLWAVSQLVVVIFSCTPVQKFWQMELAGTCVPNLPFWYINAAGNIATDLAIFIMPLPVLNKLQLRKKQKYLLMAIFSLGFFTCAISLIRLSYLKQGPDFTFDNVPTSCWSVGELTAGITCACLPTLRPLASKIKPSWITSYATKRSYGGSKAYGDGVFGNPGDSKVASHRSRSQHDSIMTSSTIVNKHYSKLRDHDIERAAGAPALPSPTYRIDPRSRSDTSLSDGSERMFGGGGTVDERLEEDAETDVPMQQIQPRLKKQAFRVSTGDKAHQVLGMGMPGASVSTKVVGGLPPSATSTHPNRGSRGSNSKSGIEVQRVVTVTTSDADEDGFRT